jgi:hypothetical protein
MVVMAAGRKVERGSHHIEVGGLAGTSDRGLTYSQFA